MIFWTLFCAALIFLYFIQDNFLQPLKMIFQRLILLIIIVISGFRYEIGWDYDAYVSIFNGIEYITLKSEISLALLIDALKSLGCDFQALFLVYSLLTIWALWRGLRFFSALPILALLFYVFVPDLYWTSFSVIRQFLAIGIVFWGSQYIVTRNFVIYSLIILIAAFNHTSAILLWPMYFCGHKFYSKSLHFLFVIVTVVIAVSSLHLDLLGYILDYFDLKYLFYVTNINYTKSISSIVIQAIFIPLWIFILIKRLDKKNSVKEILVINMLTIGIAIDFLTNFSQPLNRLTYYFSVYRVVMLCWILDYFKPQYKKLISYVMLVVFAMVFLLYISRVPLSEAGINHPDISASNIEYKLNFQLFR